MECYEDESFHFDGWPYLCKPVQIEEEIYRMEAETNQDKSTSDIFFKREKA